MADRVTASPWHSRPCFDVGGRAASQPCWLEAECHHLVAACRFAMSLSRENIVARLTRLHFS
eukprot:11879131-Heterocapsa_arctica.AAC.1